MKSKQRFEWVEGQISRKTYLLTPHDVQVFNDIISKGLGPEYAFTQLTGKSPKGKADLRLIQEFIIED